MPWHYDEIYPRSTPIRVKNGIKAASGRKMGGQQWWSRQWLAMLTSFNLGARLSRGRSYARAGQVTSIEISPGIVIAKVQGSRTRPYDVRLSLRPISETAWNRIIEKLAEKALFAAKLLAGEMPPDIEKVFTEADAPLFPVDENDIITDCSCPDWSNPCKHIAAVYYLLGEEFDRDPFLIFTLRGMSREDLLPRLHEAAGSSGSENAGCVVPLQPLPLEATAFWEGASVPEDLPCAVHPQAGPTPLLRHLGNLPFWRGSESLIGTLHPIYIKTAQRSLDCYLKLTGGED